MVLTVLVIAVVICVGLALSKYRYVPVYWSRKQSSYSAPLPLLDSLASSENPFATLIFSVPFTGRGFLVRRHDGGFSVQLATGLPLVRHYYRAKFKRACGAEGLELVTDEKELSTIVPGPSLMAVAKIKSLMATTYGHRETDDLALTPHFFRP